MQQIYRLKPQYLRLLLKIMETGQLQIAADTMGMSQPAASRIVADIEKQMGVMLFLRTPKGMELTEVGAAIMRHAQVIAAEYDALGQEIDALKFGRGGNIRIGTVTGPAVGVVLPALQKMRSIAPEISFTIEVGPSTDLVRGLDDGRFDFIMARIPTDHDSRDFLIYPARSEIVKLIVRDCHPLAQSQNIPLEALKDYDWVIQERGSPIRQAVETAHFNAGLETPNRVINSSSLLVVQSLLAQSDIIAPQSQEVAELLTGPNFGAKLTLLHTQTEMTVSPYYVIRQRARQLPRAAALFLETVLREL